VNAEALQMTLSCVWPTLQQERARDQLHAAARQALAWHACNQLASHAASLASALCVNAHLWWVGVEGACLHTAD
jgi:hypothetical protein